MKHRVILRVELKAKLWSFLSCFTVSVWCSVAQTNAPYIISEPQDRTVTAGDSVRFRVIAGGDPPLSYQWTIDGWPAPWGLYETFSWQCTSWGGHYAVTISNLAGTVTSREALLTILPMPCVVRPIGYSPVATYVFETCFEGSSRTNWPPRLPLSARLFKPDPGNQEPGYFWYEGFSVYPRSTFGSGWIPHTPSAPRPGFAAIVELNGDASFCFSTNHPPVELPLDLPPGLSLVCGQFLEATTFEDIVGRPPNPDTRLYRYTNGVAYGFPLYPTNIEGTTFSVYAFTNATWSPNAPLVPLGEAVWVLQPPKLPVPGLVAGQLQFPIRTATYATMDLEYSDALDGGSSWHLLSHVVGSGNVTNVVDEIGTNAAPHRFYRLNLRPGLP